MKTKPFLWALVVFLLPSLALAAGTAVVVAVLDTGMDISHPAFSGKIYTNPGEIAGDLLDNDANGLVDDVHGWDFDQGDNTPAGSSGAGAHGTQTAGRVAQGALDAPLFILPIQVGPGPFLWLDAILDGIGYAVAQGARIISMSFGTSSNLQVVREAVEQAAAQGVLLVASAGNGGSTALSYPAAYPQVTSVAASDAAGHKAWFSTYGTTVDLTAPGEDVVTPTWGGGTAVVDGTSFSAPYVAGVMARILAAMPGLTPIQVMEKLLEFVKDVDALNPLYTGLLGRGLVDEEVAQNVADGLPLEEDPDPPPPPPEDDRTRLERELQEAREELALLEQELETAEQELADARQAAAQADSDYRLASQTMKAAQKNYDAAKKAYRRNGGEELRRKMEEALRILQEAQRLKQEALDRLRAAQQAVTAARDRRDGLEDQIAATLERIADLERQLANLALSADTAQQVMSMQRVLQELSRPAVPAGLRAREVPDLSLPEAGSLRGRES